MAMTHGSLFSGIGGFDLASEWMGWDNKFHCEWNEFGQKVLHYYWPEAELFTDITKSNFTKYANKIDILTGGFPCQPYSSAGKRLGKEDSRHLWPEMLRAIREIQPRWVVGENVRGLTNWNGGLVFDEVQSDLEAEGYEVLPFLLPACAVNAPHRRDRIWFVAYSTRSSKGTNELRSIRPKDGEISGERSQTIHNAIRSNGSERIATNTNSNGLDKCDSEHEVNTSKGGEYAQRDTQSSNDNGDVAYTNSRRLEGSKEVRRDGINAEWQSEFGDAANTNGKRYSSCGKSQSIERNRSNDNGESQQRAKQTEWVDGLHGFQWDASCSNSNGIFSNTSDKGLERMRGEKRGFAELHNRRNENKYWENFPSVTPICNGNDGISDRLDSITFPKWRNESIKAGGNAIVPQVVYQIFKAIEQYEVILQNA